MNFNFYTTAEFPLSKMKCVKLIFTRDDGGGAVLVLVLCSDPGVERPPVLETGHSLNGKDKQGYQRLS